MARGTNSGRIRNPFQPLLFIVCFIVFSAHLMSQERYSADSLIASFGKNSRSAPKGSSIAFTDVVVESKKGKVVFKSSGNDKVTCELGTSADNTVGPGVGTTVTVIGRVRGRGVLGNITLDDCRLKAAEIVTEAVPTVIDEPPPTPTEPPVEATTEPVSPTVDTKESEPIAVPAPAVTSKSVAPVRTRQLIPADATPAPSYSAAPKTAEIPTRTMVPSNQPANTMPHSSQPWWMNIAYGIAGFLVGVALLSCIRLAPSAARMRQQFENPPTADTRRVALERLLSRQK